MKLDESHEANRSVLALLRDHGGGEAIVAPDAHSGPYMGAGSHPDVVERVWDALGSKDSRAIVYGSPALVHAGIVIAFAHGTA